MLAYNRLTWLCYNSAFSKCFVQSNAQTRGDTQTKGIYCLKHVTTSETAFAGRGEKSKTENSAPKNAEKSSTHWAWSSCHDYTNCLEWIISGDLSVSRLTFTPLKTVIIHIERAENTCSIKINLLKFRFLGKSGFLYSNLNNLHIFL